MSDEDGHNGSLLVEVRFTLPEQLNEDQIKVINEVFNTNENIISAEKR